MHSPRHLLVCTGVVFEGCGSGRICTPGSKEYAWTHNIISNRVARTSFGNFTSGASLQFGIEKCRSATVRINVKHEFQKPTCDPKPPGAGVPGGRSSRFPEWPGGAHSSGKGF